MLRNLPPKKLAKELQSLTDEVKAHLLYDWAFWARPDQRPPEGDWSTWVILAGRGWGKTRTGAEWVKVQVEAGAKRIALIAETQKDLEQVMVEGDSGLLSVFPPHQRPSYKKKPVELTFHTGAIALGYNATEPGQLRGPQFDAAWCDELAKWRYARETWDMLQFGLRLGQHPRQIITTTPRPIPLLKEIVEDDDSIVTTGKTSDNQSNLAGPFLRRILAKYEGTRLGRQELDAEILGDMPGAIWQRERIDETRRSVAPMIGRKVVAIDPAVSSDESSEEPGTHGIVCCGLGEDGRGYVLSDDSMQGTPLDWARAAVSAFDRHEADQVVVEINQGGDMVVSTLRTVRSDLPIRRVRASRGKHVRAEPVAALYEQGKISHVGSFPAMEDQMCQFTNEGYQGEGSPDRVDALVWAMSDLFKGMVFFEEPKKEAPAPSRRYFKPREDSSNYKVL